MNIIIYSKFKIVLLYYWFNSDVLFKTCRLDVELNPDKYNRDNEMEIVSWSNYVVAHGDDTLINQHNVLCL